MSMPALEQLQSRLTPEQQAVVTHGEGHARVSAVAGAGKTSTLVARVMHLLSEGVSAERIMVLMFNRQAREDFSRKLKAVATPGQALPQVRTFHSVGHRLTTSLTRWNALTHRQLLDADWQWERLCKQAVQEVVQDNEAQRDVAFDEDNLELFGQFCDQVKGRLEAPELLIEQESFGPECAHFPAAYHALEALLARQQVMTYADLLHRPLKCLVKHRSLRERVSGFLDHIIVDEYQDINEAQNRLLAILAGGRAQVMAVGDANQCIYAWRGASVDAMRESFERQFGTPVDYPLSYTFRHGHALALLANHAIAGNADEASPLTLAAPTNPDTDIAVSSGVVQALEALQTWRTSYVDDDIAILVRSWSQSVALQLHMLRHRLPFRLGRADRFVFRLPLVKALAGYLEVVRHPLLLNDPDHLTLLFSQPPAFVAQERLTMLCRVLAQTGRWPDGQDSVLNGLKPFQQRTLRQRWELIQGLPRRTDDTPAALLEHVTETLGADKLLRRAAARREKGEEDIRLLDVLIEQAGTLAEDLDGFIELLKAPGNAADMQAHPEGILITTMHGAKGLEWPCVMLWGLNEEECPRYSRDEPLTSDGLAEERRLFYVGVTRAREHLMLFSDGGQRRPSRFIDESAWRDAMAIRQRMLEGNTDKRLDVAQPELVKRYLSAAALPIAISAIKQARTAASAPTKAVVNTDSDSEWQVGDQLHHARFGAGVVTAVTGDKARCLLDVRFDAKRGVTRLMAAQAPLSRL